jgi:hypothetical protein
MFFIPLCEISFPFAEILHFSSLLSSKKQSIKIYFEEIRLFPSDLHFTFSGFFERTDTLITSEWRHEKHQVVLVLCRPYIIKMPSVPILKRITPPPKKSRGFSHEGNVDGGGSKKYFRWDLLDS